MPNEIQQMGWNGRKTFLPANPTLMFSKTQGVAETPGELDTTDVRF